MNPLPWAALLRSPLHWSLLLCLFLTLTLSTGCDNGVAVDPPDDGEIPPEEDSRFARYVALGSDLTAGVQADGINRQTQSETYVALVARALGTEFNAPLLAAPGCPPPITDAFTGTRQGAEDSCAGLGGAAPSVLHNVAVPGARIGDLIAGDDAPENPMNTLMLGGRSQLEALAEAEPTFVSVWFGTEELIQHLLGKNDGVGWYDIINSYGVVLDSLEAMGVQGGVVIGVPFLHYRLPYFTSGLQYVEAKMNGLLPSTFAVDDSCENPWRGGWQVPYRYGFNDLMKRAQAGETVMLDCENDGPVLSPLAWEITVNNQSIMDDLKSMVEARGWAYVEVTPPPDYLLPFTDASLCDVPAFPNLPGSSEPTFGACFSLDGLRPSALGHKILAQHVLDAINETYGTSFAVE